jgi:putative DNA primase/helicase
MGPRHWNLEGKSVETPLDIVERALESAGCDPGRGVSRCPGHVDNVKSLSYGENDAGDALIRCHAGCDTGSILDLLDLTFNDLFVSGAGDRSDTGGRYQDFRGCEIYTGSYVESRDGVGAPIHTYVYTDAQGLRLYDVLRFAPKTFRVVRATPSSGPLERVPYRLPEVVEGVRQGRWIFIVEGEKDVETLRAHGFVATTTGGATSWAPTLVPVLRGARVCILPDNDAPGREYASAVAQRLEAELLRVVELPGLPEKGDVTDFFDLGGSREQLIELVNGARDWTPTRSTRYVRQAAVVRSQVEWLWPGRIPFGALTMLDGWPGQGKSTFTQALVAATSRGETLPGPSAAPKGLSEPSVAIMLSGEDSLEATIAPNLDAMRAHPDNVVHLLDFAIFPDHLEALEAFINEMGARLVIVDPLIAFLNPRVDFYRDSVRQALAPMAGVAQRTGAAFVLVRHVTKGGVGQVAMARGGGAIGVIGQARSGLVCGRVGHESVIATAKSNLWSLDVSMCFQQHSAEAGGRWIEWTGTSDLTADQVIDWRPNAD